MDSKRLHPLNYTNVSHRERCNMSPARNLTNKLFIYFISPRERFIIQFSLLVGMVIDEECPGWGQFYGRLRVHRTSCHLCWTGDAKLALISCVPIVHAVAFHSLVLMPLNAKRLSLRNLCASSKAERVMRGWWWWWNMWPSDFKTNQLTILGGWAKIIKKTRT